MSPRTRWLLALAATLGIAFGSAASAAPEDPEAEARERILAEEAGTVRRATGTVRVRFAEPHRVAVAVGLVASRAPDAWACAAACDHHGFSAQFEIGTGGAQVGAGWARVIGPHGRAGRWIVRPYLGWGVRAVALRTWDGSNLDPAARTLGGLEGSFTIVGVSATFAVYRELAGPAEGDWRIGGGLGWGF